jgi:RNA polymerase sigma-70 factor (ECF subfamily)
MSTVSIDAEIVRQRSVGPLPGERAVVERLVREHGAWVRSAVFAVTGRVDLVDDVVQQVWMRVWQRISTLENPGQVRTWLYAIARNAAIDVCVAEHRHQVVAQRLRSTSETDGERSAVRKAPDRELHDTLLEAVRALPAIYREPFALRHLEDWSYAQIGAALGLSVETVETRLVRARRMLRELLHDKVQK